MVHECLIFIDWLFADNGGDFANIKLDEFTSKLGLTVKFGPFYSPWSNGVNKHNHALADLIIKKQMEDVRCYSLILK